MNTAVEQTGVKYLVIGSVIIVGVILAWQAIKAQLSSNPQGATGSATNPTGTTAGNIGNGVANAITGAIAGSTGNDYQNAGVIGTLAAGTNEVSGNTLDSLGTWIGGKLADVFQPVSTAGGSIPTSNQSGEQSDAIQTSSNRPYNNGNNAAYMDAWNSSPTDPTYAVSGDPSLATVDTKEWE